MHKDNEERIISLKTESNLDNINLELVSELNSAKERLNNLSKNELKILKLKQEGNSYQQISNLLLIKEGTVRTHLSKALRKLALPDILDYLLDKKDL